MEAVFLLNGQYFKTVAIPKYMPDICLHIRRRRAGLPHSVRFNRVMLAFPPNTQRTIYVAEISSEHYAGLVLPVYIEKEQ